MVCFALSVKAVYVAYGFADLRDPTETITEFNKFADNKLRARLEGTYSVLRAF